MSSIEPECEESLRTLASHGYPIIVMKGSSQIDLARSCLASQSLQEQYTETLWVDADIQFKPEDVERLRSHNLPITAGLYPQKGNGEFAGKHMDETKKAKFGIGGGLLEMRYVGMGFTHVRSEVYWKIKQHFQMPDCGGGYNPGKTFTPFFITSIAPDGAGGMCYLSEDYSFCHRVRECGFKIMADTTIRLGHAGRKVYTWDDVVAQKNYDSVEVEISHPKIGS